ncbi:MAG: hypothetical protein IPP15_20010 [Saprospiraceae bacterium]|uniref:Uncharacterized protein n=1 Tax=Candidatus Opimibacter skivensis TaxID=2982028 RepID=A0A9D7SWZ3_9BACT|nr:hypothetical protein [Candidatus Opimibacter skivensis]
MIEVFKTNVNDDEHAKMLIDQILFDFSQYKANFDLDDCDRILRIESVTGYVESQYFIDLLNSFGYNAERLPDDPSFDLSKTNTIFHAIQEI